MTPLLTLHMDGSHTASDGPEAEAATLNLELRQTGARLGVRRLSVHVPAVSNMSLSPDTALVVGWPEEDGGTEPDLVSRGDGRSHRERPQSCNESSGAVISQSRSETYLQCVFPLTSYFFKIRTL